MFIEMGAWRRQISFKELKGRNYVPRFLNPRKDKTPK